MMHESELLIMVGANIKRVRAQKKLSQNQLATSCKFEKASMSRIEAGKTNVTLLTLLKISNALDVNIVDLLQH